MSYPTLRRIRASQRQFSGRYAAGGAPGLCHATRPKCAKGCAHELRKDDRGGTNVNMAAIVRGYHDSCWLRCDLTRGTIRRINLVGRLNPPILHRKELLLPAEHPLVPEAVALTRRLQRRGAFRDTTTIGTRLGWHSA